MFSIMLFNKRHQRAGSITAGGAGRELRAITQMTPAADHRKVDAHHPVLFQRSDDIDILVSPAVYKLTLQYSLQGANLIATSRSFFKRQAFCSFIHARAQGIEHLRSEE